MVSFKDINVLLNRLVIVTFVAASHDQLLHNGACSDLVEVYTVVVCVLILLT